MTDPFDSYKLYNALKLHFETDGYDAIKYNYKSNVSPQSFFKRRDKYFFAKLAKNYEKDLLTYFVSNFKNGVGYVGDMINEDGERNYLDHKRIQESIHRVFSIDINKLNEQGEMFDNLFKSVNGQLPLVIKIWMQEEISLETVVILNSIFGFIGRESEKISDTIIWPDTKRKIEKYTPFVNYNKDKCLKLLTKVFI
jgi:hypothetical protein